MLKYLIVCLLLTGCTADLSYPRTRVTNQILNATNSCLDHGGVFTFHIHVSEDIPYKGPIIGATCMDEKYFEVSKELTNR